MVEEIEELIEKVDNIEETSMTLENGFTVHENEFDNLAQETHVCEAVVNKEIGECKMHLQSSKNIVGFFLGWLYE